MNGPADNGPARTAPGGEGPSTCDTSRGPDAGNRIARDLKSRNTFSIDFSSGKRAQYTPPSIVASFGRKKREPAAPWTHAMRGVAATAVLALAAGCGAYPHSSRQAGTLQQQPLPLTSAKAGNPDDCTEPDSFAGVFPRSSLGGFCCLFCDDDEGNRDALICCPSVDQHGQVVSASPDPKRSPCPAAHALPPPPVMTSGSAFFCRSP